MPKALSDGSQGRSVTGSDDTPTLKLTGDKREGGTLQELFGGRLEGRRGMLPRPAVAGFTLIGTG